MANFELLWAKAKKLPFSRLKKAQNCSKKVNKAQKSSKKRMAMNSRAGHAQPLYAVWAGHP
jgi:hypothetical protein